MRVNKQMCYAIYLGKHIFPAIIDETIVSQVALMNAT